MSIPVGFDGVAIITAAVYISKQREVSISSDGPGTPAPPVNAPVNDPAPSDGPTQPVQPTV